MDTKLEYDTTDWSMVVVMTETSPDDEPTVKLSFETEAVESSFGESTEEPDEERVLPSAAMLDEYDPVFEGVAAVLVGDDCINVEVEEIAGSTIVVEFQKREENEPVSEVTLKLLVVVTSSLVTVENDEPPLVLEVEATSALEIEFDVTETVPMLEEEMMLDSDLEDDIESVVKLSLLVDPDVTVLLTTLVERELALASDVSDFE